MLILSNETRYCKLQPCPWFIVNTGWSEENPIHKNWSEIYFKVAVSRTNKLQERFKQTWALPQYLHCLWHLCSCQLCPSTALRPPWHCLPCQSTPSTALRRTRPRGTWRICRAAGSSSEWPPTPRGRTLGPRWRSLWCSGTRRWWWARSRC